VERSKGARTSIDARSDRLSRVTCVKLTEKINQHARNNRRISTHGSKYEKIMSWEIRGSSFGIATRLRAGQSEL
jgi:hypothetical protein